MMDPSIGWYQPEHKGPALQLYKNVWKKSNSDIPSNDNFCNNCANGIQVWKTASSYGYGNGRYAKKFRDNPSSTFNFDNNRHLIRKYHGTPWRPLREFYDSGIEGLHQEIEDFYKYMKPKQEERLMRNDLKDRITKIIEDLLPHTVVDCFGSFKTETYLPTSDIDLVVMGKLNALPFHQLQRKFIELGICLPTEIRVLDRASVPIIKLTDHSTQVRINISFNLPNVLKSVELIKDYKSEFPNLEKLILVIKHFVLQRDLNEVFTGGISSYSLLLMIVSFFQLHPRVEAKSPNANLGVLLLEFFQFYGQLFNYNCVALKIRDGGSYAVKSELMKNMDNNYRPSLLCIEDPLDPKNNVSKNSYAVFKVKNSFDYAYDILLRAVGPLSSTVDQTKSILGRIIRVTDEVIDYRDHIVRRYSSRKKIQHKHQTRDYDNKFFMRKFHNSNRNLQPNNGRYNNRHNHYNSYYRQNDYYSGRNTGYPIRKQRSNTLPSD